MNTFLTYFPLKHHRLSLPRYTRGFTLIEVVVALALLSIIATLVFTAFTRLGSHQILEQETSTVRAFLEEARMYTVSSREASAHGVLFSSGGVVLFRGDSWSNVEEVLKEHSFDSTVEISTLSLEGDSEIVFTRLFGEPSTHGEITLSSTRENTTRVITVLEGGLVE